MKHHRFFGKIIDPQIQHQIKNVLKLRPEEHVLICDGEGNETETTVSGTIIATRRVAAEPERHVTLYAAMLKRENFEYIVQKATELGIKEIIPLITERTVKLGFKRERLETIAREAAELSGRGVVPIIHESVSFTNALEKKINDARLLFDSSGSPWSYESSRFSMAADVFIGPEGGWTDGEIALAKQNGLEVISLGPLTFRGETAALIATYLVVHTPSQTHHRT